MPGKSGLDFLKEHKEYIDTPIILLTAKGEVENRIHGLEIGADDYIGKPFDPKELLLRVKNVIKMNIDPNSKITPPSLSGIALKTAYHGKKYHSGTMWAGVTNGFASM